MRKARTPVRGGRFPRRKGWSAWAVAPPVGVAWATAPVRSSPGGSSAGAEVGGAVVATTSAVAGSPRSSSGTVTSDRRGRQPPHLSR